MRWLRPRGSTWLFQGHAASKNLILASNQTSTRQRRALLCTWAEFPTGPGLSIPAGRGHVCVQPLEFAVLSAALSGHGDTLKERRQGEVMKSFDHQPWGPKIIGWKLCRSQQKFQGGECWASFSTSREMGFLWTWKSWDRFPGKRNPKVPLLCIKVTNPEAASGAKVPTG